MYRDDDNGVNTQLQRFAQLHQQVQREMARGWLPPAVKFHDFLNAMGGANACKQPGIDGVVVEMQRALSWPTLLWVYLLFLVRLGGWETGRDLKLGARSCWWRFPRKRTRWPFVRCRTSVHHLSCKQIYVRALQTAVRRKRKPHSTSILGFCAWEMIHCRSHGFVETSAQQGGRMG